MPILRHLAKQGFSTSGSTHVLYEPLDLIAKLAALIPRPHKNLVLYHGVLSANAALRSRVYGRLVTPMGQVESPASPLDPASRAKRRAWALRRAFGHDLLACPQCGGKMVLLACILDRSTIRRILAHLGMPTEPPSNARASPDSEPLFDDFA